MARAESGSVLMEFLIVLPIYMLIFGFVFVAGEMSLETLHLDASADRIVAMAPTDRIATRNEESVFDYFKRVVAPHDARDGMGWDQETLWQEKNDYSYDGDVGEVSSVSSYRKLRIERAYDGDDAIEGPWAQAVAAWVKDDYTLTPLTRGLVAFWYRENNRMLEDLGDAPDNEGTLYEILGNDSLGRVVAVGKSLQARNSDEMIRQYGYYCLRRDDAVRNVVRDDSLLPYRQWPAGALASGNKWQTVAGEQLPSTDYREIDNGEIPGKLPPGAPSDIPAYSRNEYFRSWMP